MCCECINDRLSETPGVLQCMLGRALIIIIPLSFTLLADCLSVHAHVFGFSPSGLLYMHGGDDELGCTLHAGGFL